MASSRRFSSNTASPGVLSRPQQAAVLDPSVELADAAAGPPTRSRSGRRATPSGGPDLELQGGRRRASSGAGSRGCGTRRRSRCARPRTRPPARRCRLPGVPAMSNSRAAQDARATAAPTCSAASSATTAASCGSDRARSSAVRTGSVTARPSTTITSSSRSRATWQHRTALVSFQARRPAGDVHPIERDVPQRQPVQHRRGLVAHDRRSAQTGRASPGRGAGARPPRRPGRTAST